MFRVITERIEVFRLTAEVLKPCQQYKRLLTQNGAKLSEKMMLIKDNELCELVVRLNSIKCCSGQNISLSLVKSYSFYLHQVSSGAV